MTLLDTTAAADAFLSSIAGTDQLALDTEGATFHRFHDRIWLIQVTTRTHAALFDPMKAGPLPGLAALLASPATEIVIHDAAGDLKSIRRDFGWVVTRIFDTRIAAQMLGIPAFGLGSLLLDWFGVKLDKAMQRADWSVRPLPPRMISYASLDTAHLLALRDRLHADLVKAGRLAWAEEEFAALETPPPAIDDDERTPAFLKVKGTRELSRRGLTYFRDLVAWREELARARDIAPFRIIGNEQLLDLADRPPGVKDDLRGLRGASPALLEAHGARLVEMAEAVRALDESALASFPPPGERDHAWEARFHKLKVVRDHAAAKLGLDPGFLCGRTRLEAVLAARPTTLKELEAVPGLRRWHVDVMGKELLAAL